MLFSTSSTSQPSESKFVYIKSEIFQKNLASKSHTAPLNWSILLRNKPFWVMLLANFVHNNTFYIILNWCPTYFHDNYPDARIASEREVNYEVRKRYWFLGKEGRLSLSLSTQSPAAATSKREPFSSPPKREECKEELLSEQYIVGSFYHRSNSSFKYSLFLVLLKSVKDPSELWILVFLCFQSWVFNMVPWFIIFPSTLAAGALADHWIKAELKNEAIVCSNALPMLNLIVYTNLRVSAEAVFIGRTQRGEYRRFSEHIAKRLRLKGTNALNSATDKHFVDTGHEVDSVKSFKIIGKQYVSTLLKFTETITVKCLKPDLSVQKDPLISFSLPW
ncbi:unnamed protein product [Trichobilharzia regenti]|nr:unnamed protein product [Trichobilharzia regenti]